MSGRYRPGSVQNGNAFSNSGELARVKRKDAAQYSAEITMDKNDIIWWPDDQIGLIINAVTARDRASWRFPASRAAKMVLPVLVMVAGLLSIDPQLGPDAPAWVRSGFEWGLLIVPPVGLVTSLAAIVLLASEWRQARKRAAHLADEVSGLGLDLSSLDSDWVFEKLLLPLARRKGISLPDGTVVRVR